jgi:hypothetical protein
MIQILAGSFDALSAVFVSVPHKFKADSTVGAKTEPYSIIVLYSHVQQTG